MGPIGLYTHTSRHLYRTAYTMKSIVVLASALLLVATEARRGNGRRRGFQNGGVNRWTQMKSCFEKNSCLDLCGIDAACVECKESCSETGKKGRRGQRKCKKQCIKSGKCPKPSTFTEECTTCKHTCRVSFKQQKGQIKKTLREELLKCFEEEECDEACNISEECSTCRQGCFSTEKANGKRAWKQCKKSCQTSNACPKFSLKQRKSNKACGKCRKGCKKTVLRPCHKACGKLCWLKSKDYNLEKCQVCTKEKCLGVADEMDDESEM